MILGTGIDILDIRRLQRVMARHGARFQSRYFTPYEIDAAEKKREAGKDMMAFSKRFAAKEACAKALGTGFVDGIFMKDIEITNNAQGKPELRLYNGALARLEQMTPPDHRAVLHLSLTDEPPYAQAQVIIEAVPF